MTETTNIASQILALPCTPTPDDDYVHYSNGGRDALAAAAGVVEGAEKQDAFPDLLAACQRTLEILDSWGPERRGHTLELLHERVSAAIAKATGQPLPAPPSGGGA